MLRSGNVQSLRRSANFVRSALVGGSFTVPVAGGRLVLGTWQQVVLCDFDNRPRQRRVLLQVTGHETRAAG